uniref:Aspartic proteinase nepenthesin-2 n=2 Tax=Cajanus cajan TaxID=3821 RepID=A0A151QXG2_CAJCA|nr:Aspartic proteinase nepenthesin-2 [Cajanus cajan]
MKENKLPKSITIPDEGLGEYLLRFYIGTPPVERFAIADTGSDLIWVQCSPCEKCTPQHAPLFDPTKSSTFRTVSCDSQPCTLLTKNEHGCARSGECLYEYGYGDQSFTSGKLGVDVINFGGGGKAATFRKLLTFGCGTYNNDTVAEKIMPRNTGLVGLGAGPLSLISQLGDEIGNKFSYCFNPLDSNSTSKLKFGGVGIEKVIKRVVSTPLILKSSDSGFYFLHLEGISVGKKVVKTVKSQTYGNIIIDSGTTVTSLKQSFYNEFVTLLKEVMGVKEAPESPENTFCFRHDVKKGFPDFVFHFLGARVRLNQQNLFQYYDTENLFCLLAHPTAEDEYAFLGSQTLVGFRVEYDLSGGKISFAPTDCTKY